MSNRDSTIGEKIIAFTHGLSPHFPLPEGVSIMNPYQDESVKELSALFYRKFYNDDQPRVLFFAINPGRMGAGITGVPFTDPFRLEKHCGIPNSLPKRKELSGGFLYEMMEKYGGIKKFYSRFMLTSLCPLGFIKEGKNVNYYDFKELEKDATPFILESIRKHREIMGHPKVCICLGQGKNYAFLKKINKTHSFFSKVFPLPHPRYVMQYKRKMKEDYIKRYLQIMEESLAY